MRVAAGRPLKIVSFSKLFPSLLLLIRVLTSHKYRVLSVAWSPDGKQIASGSSNNTIKIFDLRSGDCQSTLTVDDRSNLSHLAPKIDKSQSFASLTKQGLRAS